MGSNMMLTISALLLFGLFATGGRALTSATARLADQSEFSLTAISIAQSVIDEAKTKAFDQNTIDLWFSVPVDSMSAVLGPDPSEHVPTPDSSSSGAYHSLSKFNDVDDYDRYTRLVNTARAGGYVVTVQVKYVREDNPEAESSIPTTLKRMDVSVTCPGISQLNYTGSNDALPIRLSYVFAY